MTQTLTQSIVLPARQGIAIRLKQGQSIQVVNTYGQQVVDTWAFNAEDMSEFMSMEHTRARLYKLSPQVGDALYTTKRRAILTLEADSSPGVHDTLIAACDRYRYELLGARNHANCTDNLRTSLAKLHLTAPEVPCPLNLFMNIPIGQAGELAFLPALSQPGDAVTLRAEMDCIVVFSACPQDLVPINGVNCTPRDVELRVLAT